MPYRWISGPQADAAPRWRLSVWPHRSLPRSGFVTFIAITFVLILLPVPLLVGTALFWGMLPFLIGAVALAYYGIARSYDDGRLREDLTLWPDRIALVRHNPRGAVQSWEANPYWVQVALHPTGGPVENYVTLRGGGREVEIGAFLNPEERASLHRALAAALAEARAMHRG